MKKSSPERTDDDLRPHYDFEPADGKPNRFAGLPRAQPVVVMLEPDVARVFRDAEAVNAVLRSIIRALPRTGSTG